MPSRPSAARRRFHRERVIAKRLQQARPFTSIDPSEFVRGRMDDGQFYVGCPRPRCGVCHPHKRWNHGDRERAEREWRRHELRAWGDVPGLD